MRPIPSPPLNFDGTLEEFFACWAKRVLLSADAVRAFHARLLAYCEEADPIFVIRAVSGLERGVTLRNESGVRLRASDNSPAWWIHHELFSAQAWLRQDFSAFVDAIPCRMFTVRSSDHVSAAGWHVAHIFPAKNGDTAYQHWQRSELARRMVRNLHPCNYFYIPKSDWQHYGSDAQVISYFAARFSEIYAEVWPEFLRLAGATAEEPDSAPAVVRLAYPLTAPVRGTEPPVHRAPADTGSECVAHYAHGRLCFRADIIEPLSEDDCFCVTTPHGTFAFTKREFYDTFPNVVQTVSYRERGIYHYPTVPARARRFLRPG